MKFRAIPNRSFSLCFVLWLALGLWMGMGPRGWTTSGSAPLAAGVANPHRDRFGGIPVRVGRPSGFFRVEKVNDRWLFLTPEGNAFWMVGIFAVDTTCSTDDLGDTQEKRILRKYGDKRTWGEQTVRRLKTWGFNTLAEYSTWYVLPTKSPYDNWSNPEKMPFVEMIRPSHYGLENRWGYARGPFKDLIAGTDPSVYTDWRGSTVPDVFDPNFQTYVDGLVGATQPEVVASPWLIGIATDDADDLFGFGPGPEVKAPRLHAHIGWLVLAGNFRQTANSNLGVTYDDPKVYSKFALRDFLQTRYGSIKALNAAWGAGYTVWDSDGGWPSGNGFLDENGRHPWVGRDAGKLSGAAPAVRSDLDDFLYEFAKKYFSVTAGCIRKHAPNHLVFGPASLNGWGGLTSRQILRAAGESLDVLQAGIGSQQVLELTAQYTGGIPIVSWEGVVANPDSSLWRYPNPSEGVPALKTQEERGQAYAQRVRFLWQARTTRGLFPVAGLKLWAYTDSWGEKCNWGLVTFSENAYDGKEALKASGKDSWGFPTGGEERNYGDFLSAVQQANLETLRSIGEEAQRAAESRLERAQNPNRN